MPIHISKIRAQSYAKKAQELRKALISKTAKLALDRILTALLHLKDPSNRPVFTSINRYPIEDVSAGKLAEKLS